MNEIKEQNKKWFSEAKFGMMIHFGLYSLIGGEWKGQRMPHIAEWAQSYFRIPNSEYGQLAKIFNPICFNAEEWVLTAKAAGMQYMVVTSKHHEGFALFKSEWDNFNSVDGTPFGRDIIGELAEACYKHGLKFGLYYSQDLDWHEPNGGGYKSGHTNCDCMSWTNDWDFTDNESKNYTLCFEGKIKTQFKEILTKYGDLATIWCDTPNTINPEQSMELYNMIRTYQPNCLVNSRIGNKIGDYCSCDDNGIDFDTQTTQSYHADVGRRNGLFECPATLNDTWGYKYYDDNWKSAERLREIRDRLNAQGVNYLLNIGPDHLGRFPAPAIDVLNELSKG